LANSWQEQPEPTDKLHKTEIPSALDPVVEQNIGRLAQAYFASPPERRQEAVTALLRELETQAASGALPQNGEVYGARPAVTCPECHHENASNQRFCGSCGAPLYADAPTGSAGDRRRANVALHESSSHESSRYETGGGILGLSPGLPEDDVQFLRDKAYSGLYDDDEGHGRWRYALALVLIVVLAVVGFREWSEQSGRGFQLSQLLELVRPSQKPAPATAQPPAAPSEAASSEPSEQNLPPQSGAAGAAHPADNSGIAEEPGAQDKASDETKSTATENSPAGDAASSSKPNAALTEGSSREGSRHVVPASLAERNPKSSSEETANPASGQEELAQAQRYLDQRDMTSASRWLWRAVGKQNTHAEVLLAGLYARGEGVPQSCDQARLLLSAAAKKGAADAAQQLHQLDVSCR